MIAIENIIINGKQFQRTYSDTGMMIEREGIRYMEAVDPIDSNRVYTETDEQIILEEYETEEAEKAAAYDILMGVAE